MKYATSPRWLIRLMNWEPPLCRGRNIYDLLLWPLILFGFWRQDQEGGYYLDGRWTWDVWNTLHRCYVERYVENCRRLGLPPRAEADVVRDLREPRTSPRRPFLTRVAFLWAYFWLSFRVRRESVA